MLHAASTLQYRDNTIDEIFKGSGAYGISKIKSVDTGFDPTFEFVGDAFWSANKHGTRTTHTDVVGDILHAPFARGI
jgi:hypothetical protein